jgi:flagellar basal-body rod modification protein FlgD
MTVSAVTQSSSSSVRSSTQSLAGNFDNFLKLLTTQLQRQDPLSPMDATSFTSQLVEFASVEQAIQTNSRLGELTGLIQSSATGSALGLLGREVTADTDEVTLAAEGDAVLRYRLAEPAAEVQISLLDDKGRTVHTLAGGGAAGENAVSWDGRGPLGNRLAAGEYTVRIEAKAADGSEVDVEQFVRGTVEAIAPQDGVPHLLVQGASVPLSAVRQIGQAS